MTDTHMLLKKFNSYNYLHYLECKFIVIEGIEKLSSKLILPQNDLLRLNINFCRNIQLLFNKILTEFKNQFIIHEFGVQITAIGIFQIWFKTNRAENDPEFLIVNLYQNSK